MSRKKCHARLRTDKDVTKVLSGSLEHNHEPDDRKTERKVFGVGIFFLIAPFPDLCLLVPF